MTELTHREYYHHHQTGDRGYLVYADGDIKMKYDRGPQGAVVEWKKHEWVKEHQHFPMSKMQIAEMAYIVVCRWFYYNHQIPKSKRSWGTLREEERIHFMKNGPKDEDAKKFFDAVMKVGEEYAR